MDRFPHNLPVQPTSFVGRLDDVTEIMGLLDNDQCRLLTLMGPGGIGKTRLALEIGGRVLSPEATTTRSATFASGVFHIPLQSIAMPENVVPAIASAIGFEFSGRDDPREQLLNFVHEQPYFLILDNFEHLLEAADLVGYLLSNAPAIKILITSRIVLSLRHEWLYHVRGLPFPQGNDTDDISGYGAVQLFTERALQVQRNFSLADEQRHVMRVCQLVEGMPLGLELAATWLRRLPCAEMVDELERSLDILTSDLRDVPDRHRNMRAVFELSWKLLNRLEQEVLPRLSVFKGGFRREAAQQIAGASLPTLSTLVDHSLLSVTSDGRYQMHELLRQYGDERLAVTPELEEPVRNRHCSYYMAFMDRPFRALYGPDGKETIREIETEIDNVRAAWDWAVLHLHTNELRRAAENFYHFSFLRNWHQEGETALKQAETALRAAEPSKERQIALGQNLALQGGMDLWRGRPQEAKSHADEAVNLLRPLNARHELAGALVTQSWMARFDPGRDVQQAKEIMLEAVDLLSETGRHELQGFILTMLGGLTYDVGQYQESEQWYRKALSLSRRLKDERTLVSTLKSLARLALILGDYPGAQHYLRESWSIGKAHANPTNLIYIYLQMADLAQATGDLVTARHYAQESLTLATGGGKPHEVADSLCTLAGVVASEGEHERARELYQKALETMAAQETRQTVTALAGLGLVALRTGDYAQAHQWVEESLRICRENGNQLQEAQGLVYLGRVALAEDRGSESRQHFRTALQKSFAIGSLPVVIDAIVGFAELSLYEGSLEEAFRLSGVAAGQSATRANTKGRAGQLLTQLEAEISPQAVAAARDFGAQVEVGSLVSEMLAQPDHAGDPTPLSRSGNFVQPLLEPLSERELEVLELVAAGRSNREIAQKLILALGTVKSHLHNIMQKLAVRSRTQAVARARELHLL